MPTVVITNFNYTTRQLYFTITGTPTPSAVTIQRSNDGGLTWVFNETGGLTSPRIVSGVQLFPHTLFRIRLETGGEYSNIWGADNQIIRTVISSDNQITFANSPVHIEIQNTAADDTIRSTTVKLWIWNGAQNKPLGNPNHTFIKDVISLNDKYISFELSDMIKAFLQDPNMTNNSNQPGFGYNANALPAVSGLGVFWQIQASVVSTEVTELIDYPTNFATLGYRWNYQQDGLGNNDNSRYGSLGFVKPVIKWFNPNVPKYFTMDFLLNQAVNICDSTSMVQMTVEAKTKTRCTRDSSLIVYLDHRGLWDVFTPHGKVISGGKIDSSFSGRVFRRPNKVNNSIAHSKLRNSITVEQTHTINTGRIDESEVQRIEELLYSPKIYLIKFLGDIVYQITDGLTIDNTFITIDSTEITIDNTPITVTEVPYFSTFQQIPVTIEDSNFVRKTLMNDKTDLDYTIKLTETTNKINSQR